MSLNTQGILAAVTIALYVPFLFFTFRVAYKYGIAGEGWILLFMFSLIRVVGGALLVAAEEITPPVIGLYIGGYALEASGLSPLLLSSLGLLHTTFQGPDGEAKYSRPFRLLHLLGLGALTLTIIGISNATSQSSSSQSTANTMRRAGVLLFALLYVIIVAITGFAWTRAYTIMKHRKTLLLAISIALPFIAVRTLYSILSTFSSDTFAVTGTATTPNTSSLAKFNMTTNSVKWPATSILSTVLSTEGDA
ncbi:hypothetical protein BV22DRAFT_131576 [Leucogyrophana mollusca]|uniref:Uncharacterized protein n=1 Tax=Leucogyrophana mollusca TaxID=85980 RepID=A0ACB8BVN9_9AGAM|nr:hypothetical protein BV22DRAFT_131576 [Leucogyrophana mollusca]